MIPIPIDLPVRPSEAAALAELVIRRLAVRGLTDDSRNRLAGEAATLGLSTLKPHFGSLESDPVHHSVYYLAIDGMAQGEPEPLLLRLAPAASPASALFPAALLIGRMRPGADREIVVNAIPFSPDDRATIDTYVGQVSRAFLPRPQGALPSITVQSRFPDISIPAAFSAYRRILRETGLNMAAPASLPVHAAAQRPGRGPVIPAATAIRDVYYSAVWAAVRAGWREGYTIELSGLATGGSTPAELDAAKDLVRHATGYSKFGIDLLPLSAGPGVELRGEDHTWIGSELDSSGLGFSPVEIASLITQLGSALKIAEDLTGAIKPASVGNRMFDIELSLAGAPAMTTPKELFFCLQWMKSRGRPVQLFAPNLGVAESGFPAHVRELASIARQFNVTLSFESAVPLEEQVLEELGRATSGRLNYKIAGGLDAHLFDSSSVAELHRLPAARIAELQSRAAHYIGSVAALLR